MSTAPGVWMRGSGDRLPVTLPSGRLWSVYALLRAVCLSWSVSVSHWKNTVGNRGLDAGTRQRYSIPKIPV